MHILDKILKFEIKDMYVKFAVPKFNPDQRFIKKKFDNKVELKYLQFTRY